MTYRLPDTLGDLRNWMRGQGAVDFATERQAAFMAQQLAGTRFKFPPKGASCFPLLQSIQRSLPTAFGRPASDRAKPILSKNKIRKAASRPAIRQRCQIEISVPVGLIVYCDGACDPNPGIGGWGFVVYRDGREIHCDCGGALKATNQTMELTGAIRALKWFAERGVIEPLRLLSDSRYVVDGSNSWRHGWKKAGWQRGGPNAKPENRRIANVELWQVLDDALTAVPIQLEWCKGHAGVVGNERADELSLIGRDGVINAAQEADPIRHQLAVPA